MSSLSGTLQLVDDTTTMGQSRESSTIVPSIAPTKIIAKISGEEDVKWKQFRGQTAAPRVNHTEF
jgi:hypothetical protein